MNNDKLLVNLQNDLLVLVNSKCGKFSENTFLIGKIVNL